MATANTNTIAEDAVDVTGNMLTDDNGFGSESDLHGDNLTGSHVDPNGANLYGTFIPDDTDGQ